MRAQMAIGAMALASAAYGDLDGTILNQFTNHTGPFGVEIGGAYEYGTTQTYVDPGFPTLSYDVISPANVAGFDNSIQYDFSDFEYVDFDGEVGSVMIDSLAEEVAPGSVHIFGDDGVTEIGMNYVEETNGFTGEWLGSDALKFDPDGGQISVFVAWDSVGGDCPPDCNGDGELSILDFVCFQLAFQAQSDLGDCDGNGVYNILDFVCFQLAFQAGCP